MALVTSNFVIELATNPGTGSVALLGATNGGDTFANRIGNGNTCYYSMKDDTDYEVGLGTFTTGPDTLARTEIIQSSNGDAAVNFTGDVTVQCTLLAPSYRVGVTLGANQSAPTSASPHPITWTNAEEDYDEGGWHDGVTNSDRFTVPAACVGRHVDLTLNLLYANNSTGFRRAQVKWYDSVSALKKVVANSTPAVTGSIHFISTNIKFGPVASGDYFVFEAWQNSGGALDIQLDSSCAQIEALAP